MLRVEVRNGAVWSGGWSPVTLQAAHGQSQALQDLLKAETRVVVAGAKDALGTAVDVRV